jgi:hypothetical protein
MTREDLINQVTEEIKVRADLGYEYEHTAQNIVALFEGSRHHLDYNLETHGYESEATT